MFDKDAKLTLLDYDELRTECNGKQLEVFKKYGIITSATDLASVTSSSFETYNEDFYVPAADDNSLNGRSTAIFTKECAIRSLGMIRTIEEDGWSKWADYDSRQEAIRPVLESQKAYEYAIKNKKVGYNGVEEVEFGEYPQYALPLEMQKKLKKEYKKNNLQKTGKSYTFDKTMYLDRKRNYELGNCGRNGKKSLCGDISFNPMICDEYIYDNKKFIIIKVNSEFHLPNKKYQLLSNNLKVKNGDMVCIEVSPVTWLIDNRDKKLIAKRGLLSGIKFNNKKYDGDFENTKMNEYLNKYMLKDLTQSVNLSYSRDDDENRRKVKNIESTTILNNNPKVRTR